MCDTKKRNAMTKPTYDTFEDVIQFIAYTYGLTVEEYLDAVLVGVDMIMEYTAQLDTDVKPQNIHAMLQELSLVARITSVERATPQPVMLDDN
jgi:hypothetical protein